MTGLVILIDDEEHLRTACSQTLQLEDIDVQAHAGAEGVLDQVAMDWPGIIVTDVNMPRITGLDVLTRALERDPEVPVILITGHGDVPMALKAMRQGAYEFIEKPFDPDYLVDAVRRALDKRRLTLENRDLRKNLQSGREVNARLLGQTRAMEVLRRQVDSFAVTDADVLILGETGAGKEMVAQSLHERSARSGFPFVAINCGGLPETMIESELFGHEAGAFTGAAKKRIGRLEHANGGTVFLDEIESMPMDLQIKLLRVIQDRKISRLGSNEEITIDVRVLAATKEDLKSRSDAGKFREDLYYRLNVLTLTIPPLRDRKEDIALLFQHFVDLACERFKQDPMEVPSTDIVPLLSHDWPGNVRELQNAATRYALGQRR